MSVWVCGILGRKWDTERDQFDEFVTKVDDQKSFVLLLLHVSCFATISWLKLADQCGNNANIIGVHLETTPITISINPELNRSFVAVKGCHERHLQKKKEIE